ncbi:putative MFS transporter [Agromyces luteolus]|uniref:MFS transporter n=1 Tax=Agromyces luteolus TaxID=88373 RepID=A0A7C9HXI6_9MICO|nr:MFS transporter [Agromyces luteolus]MUN06540.1 MFS transporter [Agromyces luteolus]GLK29295.1 putative MFS transporter [Agromyces luteolus]
MSPESTRPLWHGRTLALLGILLVAFNLRTAVASLSPILDLVGRDIPVSTALVGILGMLPPLCYAVFGIATPVLTRRAGLEPVLVGALVALVVGSAARGLVGSAWWLFAASALTFAAVGVGNVLLPPLVKRYFPDRIGLVTALYVTALSVSTFVPPLVAVPVSEAAGWRASLELWAAVALAALVPWVALLVHPRRAVPQDLPEEAEPGLLRRAFRSPLAWALATVFSVAGFNAYAVFAWLPSMLADTAGTGAAAAGVLLALYAAMGLPVSLVVPALATRPGRVRAMVAVAGATIAAGWAGLLVAPGGPTWLWVALAGIGPLLFPLSLVLVNLRTRTHAGSVALSGFVQSVGYVVVALGPIAVGLLHEATGSWTPPMVLLLATSVPALVAGLVVARAGFLEDEPAR